MAEKRRNESKNLEERIARIRSLTDQFDHMHELLTRNTELFAKDRLAIGAGVLCAAEELARFGGQAASGTVQHRPARRTHSRHPRRR